MAKDEALEENKKKFALMNEFCKHRNLPEPLRLRLLRLMDFHYSKVRQYYGASKIHLPPALVMRVMSSQFKSVVDTCVLRGGPLHGCNPQFLNRILLNLSEVREKNTLAEMTPRRLRCDSGRPAA